MSNNKHFYGWYVVVASVLLNAVGLGLFSSILGLFFPSIVQEHGFSQAAVSSIIAFAMLGGLIASITLGKLFQTKSIRYLVLILGLIEAVTIASMAMTSSLTVIYIISVCMGIATIGGTTMSTPALITNWFDKSRGMAMGISMAGAGLGPAIMAPVITSMIVNYGYRNAFVVLGAIVFVCVITAFLLIKDNPGKMGMKPYGQNAGDMRSEKQAKENKLQNEYSFTLKEASKTKAFFGLVILGFLAGTIVQGVLIQIPSYLRVLDFDARKIGMVIGTYALLAGFGKIAIGYVYDKLGLIKGNFIFYTAMTLSFLSLVMLQSMSNLIYVYIILAGIGMGVNIVALPLFTAELFGTKYYSTIYPVMVLVSTLGSILGSVVSGVVIDISGYPALFSISFVGGFLSLIVAQVSIKSGFKKKELLFKESMLSAS